MVSVRNEPSSIGRWVRLKNSSTPSTPLLPTIGIATVR